MKKALYITVTVLLAAAFAYAQTNPSNSGQSSYPSGKSTSMQGMPAAQGGSDEQQLTSIEQQWCDAMKSGDTSALSRIEADNYVFTSPSGKITTKQEDVSGLQSGQMKTQVCTPSNLQVHVSGDTAIVTGQLDLKGIDNGKDVSGKYAFTDTFVKRNGQWQAIATQSSKLPSSQMPQ